jgi:isopenicillin-N N-acyltransferase like protein
MRSMSFRFARWGTGGRVLFAVGCIGAAILFAHASIGLVTRVDPPRIELPGPKASHGWTRTRAGLREVFLQGSPEEIGVEHARLMRNRMIANEVELWSEYERYVPWWIARVGIVDWSLLRYRTLDQGIPEARRRELAAEALAFDPDPLAARMATYQRMVFLHSLYDIALPLEHSPLIGCTTFALAPEATADGHVIVARAFDFEAGEAVDRDKAVFLVREDGAIPFASVAWPGFLGVVTGMNAEGVVMVVHGARARDPATEGMPVAFSLREALEHGRSTAEVVRILRSQRVLVSHIVFVADAHADFAIVERAPGIEPYVRRASASIGVTNHFEGPLAADPKNVRVRKSTTSVARRERLDELLERVDARSATPEGALAILRDHRCAGGVPCDLGDRRTIDALIATHGIVADLTAGVLWVGVGPNLSGKFVRLDLRALLAPDRDASNDPEPDALPEDPILLDGRRDRALLHRDTASR